MDEHVIDNPQVYNIIYYNISIIGVSWIHVNNHHIYLWIGFPILRQPSNLSTPLYFFICIGDWRSLYTHQQFWCQLNSLGWRGKWKNSEIVSSKSAKSSRYQAELLMEAGMVAGMPCLVSKYSNIWCHFIILEYIWYWNIWWHHIWIIIHQSSESSNILNIYIFPHHIHLYTSTAPGGGRSFNDKKL